ncbi:MAG: hypothetical protein JKY60_20465 [Kordiimonadaceae bacterium]|nr:hypothetical protein [Kordiimonadaceae bacterium]
MGYPDEVDGDVFLSEDEVTVTYLMVDLKNALSSSPDDVHKDISAAEILAFANKIGLQTLPVEITK